MREEHALLTTQPAAVSRRKSIWVVTDNSDSAREVKQLLGERHDVRHFDDAGAALEQLTKGGPPSLIMLDGQLPGRMVRTTCVSIRQRYEQKALPVLLMVPRADFEVIDEALNEGANDFVVIPGRATGVLARIRSLLTVSEQAHELKQQWRGLFEESPTLVARLRGPQHVYEAANPAYLKAIGGRSVIGKSTRDAFPELAPTPIYELLDRVYRTGEPFVARELLIPFDRDGSGHLSDRYFDFVYRPTRAIDGSVDGIYFHGVDVTAEVVTRSAAETGRKRLASLLSQTPIAICMFERPGLTYTFANEAYLGLVGGRALIGKQLHEALPEIAHQGLDRVLENVFTTGETFHGKEVLFKLAHHGPDEFAVMNFQYTARRDMNGVIDGVIATVVDVTEQVLARRRAEELAAQLQSGERELRLVTDAVPLLISFVTADETYGLVNKAYEEWFGTSRTALVGKKLRDVIGESAYAVMLPHIRRGLAGERFHFEQYDVPYRLGGKRDVRVEFVPRRNAAGEVDGYVALLQDITAQRASEREREALFEREQAARADAQRANRSKDEFLAMLGHELRNPLAPIATALQLMKLRGGDAFQHERNIIERQVKHLSGLVDDLLDVSRITSGKVELNPERLDLAGVLAVAMETVSPLLEQRRHRVSVSVPANGLTVHGDPLRLAQVISNLLTNAAKYTEPGGQIVVSAKRDGDEVVVRIRDNGIGMSAEVLPHVFETFTQEQQAIDRSRGGLGLGLSIARSLMAMHNGTITAHSEGRGRGSEFVLRLPAVTDQAGAAVASRPSEPASQPRKDVDARRILIVDDNVDAAELLATTLEFLGHEPRVAHDGPSALDVVSNGFEPDLAVLDIGLPVMDGYELGRRLRDMPRLKHTRLVALTGYGQRSDKERSVEAGFDAHIVKPVHISTLEALIKGDVESP